MGSPEVVILIVLGLIILLPLLMKAAGRADRRRPAATGGAHDVSSAAPTQPLRPTDLPGVRAAITSGDWAGAVDLYHQASGLPRAQAESAVMAVVEPGPNQTGADPVAEPPADGDDDWPGLPDRNRRRGDG